MGIPALIGSMSKRQVGHPRLLPLSSHGCAMVSEYLIPSRRKLQDDVRSRCPVSSSGVSLPQSLSPHLQAFCSFAHVLLALTRHGLLVEVPLGCRGDVFFVHTRNRATLVGRAGDVLNSLLADDLPKKGLIDAHLFGGPRDGQVALEPFSELQYLGLAPNALPGSAWKPSLKAACGVVCPAVAKCMKLRGGPPCLGDSWRHQVKAKSLIVHRNASASQSGCQPLGRPLSGVQFSEEGNLLHRPAKAHRSACREKTLPGRERMDAAECSIQ